MSVLAVSDAPGSEEPVFMQIFRFNTMPGSTIEDFKL